MKMLVAACESIGTSPEMEAYINSIYDEYFDHRMYLIE